MVCSLEHSWVQTDGRFIWSIAFRFQSVYYFRRDSKVFRVEASFGFCASKDETYYGFKGMLLTTEYAISGYGNASRRPGLCLT